MYGKYADRRVCQHLVHTYSRVPYLDNEIFNIGERSKRLQRQTQQRVTYARQGLERINNMSQQLQTSLKQSKNRREKEFSEFIETSAKAENVAEEQKKLWSPSEYINTKQAINQQNGSYQQKIIGTNSTRASSFKKHYRRIM